MSQLTRIVARPKKRLGRGHGSGKVKTAGRGTKGQKARGKMPQGFEGGQLPLIKRVPLLRGKGKNDSQRSKIFILPVAKLDTLPKGTDVTITSLKKHGLIGEKVSRVKILGSSKLANTYTVKVATSRAAKSAIEKAGGKVEN